MAYEENSWLRAVLARHTVTEGESIWWDTQPWYTTPIASIIECPARLHKELHQFRWLINVQPKCVTPTAGKDTVRIMCPATMSLAKIYTPCDWPHLCYTCISVCITVESLSYYLSYHDVVNHVTVAKMPMINETPFRCATLKLTTVRVCHWVFFRASAQVSATLLVSPRLALTSQLLLQSRTALRRCLSSSKSWIF